MNYLNAFRRTVRCYPDDAALELLDRGSFGAAIHAGTADVDHPDVEPYEAVVVGVPDDEWGEVVCGAVVTGGSADVDAADLDDFCAADDSLADFKRPRRYALRDDPLPRTDTGTIRRDDVRENHFGGE